MQSRTSQAIPRRSVFLSVSLALICTVCCSANGFSQTYFRNGNITTYKGNRFEMKPSQTDTTTLVDPVDGHEIIKISTSYPVPLKMNGAKIFPSREITQPPYARFVSNETLEEYIYKGLSQEFAQLPDNTYSINIYLVVLDNKGTIAFYEYDGMQIGYQNEISEDQKKAIASKIELLMNTAPAFLPGKMNGSAVPVFLDTRFPMDRVEVKDHKVSISKSH